MEILGPLLGKLAGADYCIAVSCLIVGVLCWRRLGTTKKSEKKVHNRQILVSLFVALLGGAAIGINHAFFQREPVFSKDFTGILVMRIVGDDAFNSLQGDLVENLNERLQKEPAGMRIEVHAGHTTIDTDKGLAAAHARARAIGQRLNAKLVLWGRKGAERKLYPRITIVAAPEGWSVKSERTLHSIDEVRLPEELVDQPFYVIRFAAGYSYYVRGNYKEALAHFEAALRHKGSTSDELADLQFCTAFCAQSLGWGQKDIIARLQEAIVLYEKAASVYVNTNQEKWAGTQNNLGNAMTSSETGRGMCKRPLPPTTRLYGFLPEKICHAIGR